eukprot:COSAG02_NODE_8316_length_2619_cov_20.653968_2_plen_145_part_00
MSRGFELPQHLIRSWCRVPAQDNMNILRDLSLLQIQMRELPAFLVRLSSRRARRKLLSLYVESSNYSAMVGRRRCDLCVRAVRLQETRRKMLDLKSNQRNNWIGFALAHHLRGDYKEASKVLQVYEETATPVRCPSASSRSHHN